MTAHTPIQLVVGLGNPGAQYEHTRHNVGAWFVTALAEQVNIPLQPEKKFNGLTGTFNVGDKAPNVHFLLPTTYMNHSGRSVSALANYFKATPPGILVAHDDLDLPVGVIRLKQGGGDGGHNGLRDITSSLSSPNYLRLRIGIGHPGHRDQVLNYVLNPPTQHEKKLLLTGIEDALNIWPLLIDGKFDKAMQKLHTK